MHITQEHFRDCLRHTASTVCVMTTALESIRHGITVTSACSLSVEPPMILVCVNKKSETHAMLLKAKCFCLNILRKSQQNISEQFSGHEIEEGEARFALGSWETLVTGAPVLESALLNLDCTLEAVYGEGTHSICVGRVVAIQDHLEETPLLYYNRAYLTLE